MNQPEKLSHSDLQSILESLLFTIGRPLSLKEISQAFQLEKTPLQQIKQALVAINAQCQETHRGIELQEVAGGWQLRTKEENKDYIRRLRKVRAFQLSPPALEVLVIVAYRQPCKKSSVEEIRGVESGHLLKTLMEKNLICFGPRSADMGRPLTYKTTARFLEVFGLKSLKDLPSSHDIQDLLSSETDSLPSNKGVDTLLHNFKDPLQVMAEQKKVQTEMAVISEEINSIKTPKGRTPLNPPAHAVDGPARPDRR